MSPAREFPGRSHLPHGGAVCGELQRRLYYQPPTPVSQRPRVGGVRITDLLVCFTGANEPGALLTQLSAMPGVHEQQSLVRQPLHTDIPELDLVVLVVLHTDGAAL